MKTVGTGSRGSPALQGGEQSPRKGVLIGEVSGYERKCIHPMRQAEDCFEYGVV